MQVVPIKGAPSLREDDAVGVPPQILTAFSPKEDSALKIAVNPTQGEHAASNEEIAGTTDIGDAKTLDPPDVLSQHEEPKTAFRKVNACFAYSHVCSLYTHLSRQKLTDAVYGALGVHTCFQGTQDLSKRC